METTPYQTAERLKDLADQAQRAADEHTNAARRSFYEGEVCGLRVAALMVTQGNSTTDRIELRRLAYNVEKALDCLARGDSAEDRRAVAMLTMALEGIDEREVLRAQREPKQTDRLARLAKRSWRSSGRRLRGGS